MKIINNGNAAPAGDPAAGRKNQRLQTVLHRLVDDGPERRAIDAGEIDAIIDYTDKNVILFPVAKRALRAASRSTFTPGPLMNEILAALPFPEFQGLRQTLEPVMLTANELLQESGAPIRYVYFPIDCVISLLATVETRRVLEVALVGSEGMTGIHLALGVNVSSVRALVGIAGSALRMREAHFREVYRKSPVLREELNHFIYTELAVVIQNAACSAFHQVEQRLARRLLMIADRKHSNRFFCTHESAAYALGTRRESITQVAKALQNRGLINYHRGNLRILNRRGLESAACSCYTRIKSRPMLASPPAWVQDEAYSSS